MGDLFNAAAMYDEDFRVRHFAAAQAQPPLSRSALISVQSYPVVHGSWHDITADRQGLITPTPVIRKSPDCV
jgi:hypothetical protein